MRKKLLALFMALTMLFVCTGCLEDEPVELGDETWAIYWYLCGSDLESEGGFATGDLSELLEVELPEDALTRRRIGFYERHGLVFNSYPYLQPPMRKGQGVLPLRLMTKPAAIDAKTYQRYKKRIHSIVYKYEGDL